MARIIHVFFDVDMRAGQAGLAEVAKKGGKSVKKLQPGEFVCFLNSQKTIIKVLAPTGEADSFGILSQYRSPHGKIDLNAVDYIPAAFGAGSFNMNKALRMSLEAKIGKKRERKQDDSANERIGDRRNRSTDRLRETAHGMHA